MRHITEIDGERLSRVTALLLDVDGVLTDGRITYTSDGEEIKSFHVRDGEGIARWLAAGHAAALVSGRDSPALRRRADELGIRHVAAGVQDKREAVALMREALGRPVSACAYVGDDLPDLAAMQEVGLSLTVADAVAEVKDAAEGVTHSLGGQGAVREIVEVILRAQGRWDQVVGGPRTQRMER